MSTNQVIKLSSDYIVKNLFLVIVLSTLSSNILSAQFFLNSVQTTHVFRNNVTVFQYARYQLSGGCPPLDSSVSTLSGSVMQYDLYYPDVRAGAFGSCSTNDTFHYISPVCKPCTLVVNTHLNYNGYATLADTDSTFFGILSGQELHRQATLEIFPNPSNGILHIKTPEARTSLVLQVINSRGERVFEKALPREEISEINVRLPPGLYQCLLQNEFGKIEAVRKLMIVR